MPQELETKVAASPGVSALDVAALDGVMTEVVETMFFTEAAATSCSHEWLETAVGARVEFEGTHCGDVCLSVSGDAARSMAGGFLGLDEAELTDAQVNQILLELANIFCGAAMSRFWPDSSLSLAAPQPIAPRRLPDGDGHRCYSLPEGMLAVTVCLRADGSRE